MSEHQKLPHTRVSLRLVEAPKIGAVVTVPPVSSPASTPSIVAALTAPPALMHADAGQVHDLLIKCTACGGYNSTDG